MAASVRNETRQFSQMRIQLQDRGSNDDLPLLRTALLPLKHRCRDDAVCFRLAAFVHLAKVSDEFLLVAVSDGAASVRNQIALWAVNLKADQGSYCVLVIVLPFLMAGKLSLCGTTTGAAMAGAGESILTYNLPSLPLANHPIGTAAPERCRHKLRNEGEFLRLCSAFQIPSSSCSIRLSTIFASFTESATLQMTRGFGLISSSRAVRTAAMREAAISSAFFCRGSSGRAKG